MIATILSLIYFLLSCGGDRLLISFLFICDRSRTAVAPLERLKILLQVTMRE